MRTRRTHSTTSRRRLAPVALLATLALTALACGDDDTATTAAGSGSGDMTISIADPAEDTQVGGSFDVTVDSSVPLGEPDTGRHHVHLYYDGNTAEGEYDLVYEPRFTVDRLDPGEHTIEAVIANADHSLTDARTEITVTVGDAAGGGPATTSDATTDTTADSGYGY